jgi:exodeoxyribonuclease V alpha subunit
LPALAAWKAQLVPPVVGDAADAEKQPTLLVRKGDRLYLRRYWEYEQKVEAALQRLNVDSQVRVDEAVLQRYFPKPEDCEQREAARNAMERRLSLLTGGPGTGKTFTLALAVALLAEMRRKSQQPLEVRLVAPTGKAAVRMVESSKKTKLRLVENYHVAPELVQAIPDQASTIHRLLGARYQSPYFHHDASNPLLADVVIVDEASMVDLPLMAKLLDALPATCSLLLVGDTDQLASVEPGRVYGDVCHAAEPGHPLAGCLSRLTRSWRFSESSLIGTVSRLVNRGAAAEAWQVLSEKGGHERVYVRPAAELSGEDAAFRKLVEGELEGFLKAKDPAGVLAAANLFRILCAVRKGPYGVERMNRRVEEILSAKGLKPGKRFYDHQLIMIRVNTPALNLFNGDVGVILAGHPGKSRAGAKPRDELQAWFPDPVQGVISVPVNLLPEHETAFAMTVHKSQGSEFPVVALILPESAEAPILTRELLYTGMTRVNLGDEKKAGALYLWCSEASFQKAVQTATERVTGLFAKTGS